MPEKRVDAIVVGGGLGGLVAAAKLGQQGMEVVLLEKAPAIGGRLRPLRWRGIDIDKGYYISHVLLPEILNDLGAEKLQRTEVVYDVFDVGSAHNGHEEMQDRVERLHPLAVEVEDEIRQLSHDERRELDDVTVAEWLKTRSWRTGSALEDLGRDLLTRGMTVELDSVRTVSVGRLSQLLQAGGPSEGRTNVGRWLPTGISKYEESWNRRSARMPSVSAAIAARIQVFGGSIRTNATVTHIARSGDGYQVDYTDGRNVESLRSAQLYVDVPPHEAANLLADDIATEFEGGKTALTATAKSLVGEFLTLGYVKATASIASATTSFDATPSVVRLVDARQNRFLGSFLRGSTVGALTETMFGPGSDASSPVLSMYVQSLPSIWMARNSKSVQRRTSPHLQAIGESVWKRGENYEHIATWPVPEKTAPLHLLQVGSAPRGDSFLDHGIAFVGDGYGWDYARPWCLDAALQSGIDAVIGINSPRM